MMWLLACAPAPSPTDTGTPPAAAAVEVVSLDAPRLLRRMSLDLRGVVPSTAELDAVEADPAALGAIRDGWLEDPRLEDRVVAVLAERWHTLVDDFDIEYYDYQLTQEDEYRYERSVGEEPLRLAAYVATSDLPWSEVVLADHTRANELLGELWPVDYPEGGTGWQTAPYTDGRPAVGVLASNGLWWRYSTSAFNENRGRAGAISRLLLCSDMLSRPVSFSSTPSLLDDSSTTEALKSEPYCLACHAAIEPIAANLFGFYPNEAYSVYEQTYYHPEREPMGAVQLGVEPAWFGQATPSLRSMAEAIARDPRFDRCAVETFATGLWRRELETTDYDRVEALRQGFVAGGTRVRPLLAAITDTPEYRAGGLVDGASATAEERERTARLLSPTQLGTMVEDLTGFQWEVRGAAELDNDQSGYRVLAGGVNGSNVLRPQDDPGLTWALVVKRLAEAGAAQAVVVELGRGEPGAGLFAGLDPEARPGDEAFDAFVAALMWRLFATRPEAAEIAAVGALWSSVEATEGPQIAWQTTLAALLRDPLAVSY